MIDPAISSSGRRTFFTRMNAGLASITALTGVAMAKPKAVTSQTWQPARHEKDDWFDKLPGKHRLVFDTTTQQGMGDALFFARNYVRVNKVDYGLESNELAIVVIARHHSTPFGFNNAMWSKYGVPMAAVAHAEDPQTKAAPNLNLYAAIAGGGQPNGGATLEALAELGVQFAVCAVASRAYAAAIAKATGGSADMIFKELGGNLVGNGRLVPAGIVAVDRAQERGYSLVTA